MDILFNTNLSPDLLTLEVTETVIIDNAEIVLPALEALRAIGIKVALDDFGTGYSSLSYLTSLPLDTIKIDRSFMANISEDQNSLILLTKIVELCGELGKRIVIEGIESKEDEEIAREKGAHVGQGFLYSPPLELAEARKLLASDASYAPAEAVFCEQKQA